VSRGFEGQSEFERRESRLWKGVGARKKMDA
jgi:hypothetical protein